MYCYSISELSKEIIKKVLPNSSVGIYNFLIEPDNSLQIKLLNNDPIDVITFFGNISNEFRWSDFFNQCTKAEKSVIIAVPSVLEDLTGNKYFLGELPYSKDSNISFGTSANIPINNFLIKKQEIPEEFILGYCTYTEENGFGFELNKEYIIFKSKEEQAKILEDIKSECKMIKPLDEKTKLDFELEEKFAEVVPYTTQYHEQLKRKLKEKGISVYRSEKVKKELEYVANNASDKLISNKVFNLNFEYACRCLSKNTGIEDFKVEILDDGKTIYIYTLSEEQSNMHNRYFDCFMFSLEGDALAVDRVVGKAYDATSNEFKENNLGNFITATTAVELNYYKTIYDQNGIELSRSSLSSVEFIPLETPYDELDLSTLVLSSKYRPEMTFDSLPNVKEALKDNYEGEVVYRNYDNLALAYCKTAFNNKDVSDYSNIVLEVDTNHPEKLTIKFGGKVGTWSTELEDYEVANTTLYGQLSFDELYDIYKEGFEDALEESKTKEDSPSVYEVLLNANKQAKGQRKRKVY